MKRWSAPGKDAQLLLAGQSGVKRPGLRHRDRLIRIPVDHQRGDR